LSLIFDSLSCKDPLDTWLPYSTSLEAGRASCSAWVWSNISPARCRSCNVTTASVEVQQHSSPQYRWEELIFSHTGLLSSWDSSEREPWVCLVAYGFGSGFLPSRNQVSFLSRYSVLIHLCFHCVLHDDVAVKCTHGGKGSLCPQGKRIRSLFLPSFFPCKGE